VEVDNKRANLNLEAKESTLGMQKYNIKQITRFKVAHARPLLQVFSKLQNFHHFPKHLS
jgi:hypothetical protein